MDNRWIQAGQCLDIMADLLHDLSGLIGTESRTSGAVSVHGLLQGAAGKILFHYQCAVVKIFHIIDMWIFAVIKLHEFGIEAADIPFAVHFQNCHGLARLFHAADFVDQCAVVFQYR